MDSPPDQPWRATIPRAEPTFLVEMVDRNEHAPRYLHLAAQTRMDAVFTDPTIARWTWNAIGRLPGAFFAILMPTHPHLVVRTTNRTRLMRYFRRLLGHITHLAGGRRHRFWEPVGFPRDVTEPKKLWSSLRYSARNECTAGFADDPLEAVYSSYRDILGGSVTSLVGPERLARALGWGRRDFAERFHKSVTTCNDHPHGTSLPEPAEPSDIPARPLQEIATAAAVATRGRLADLRTRSRTRKVFVGLARHQGWRDTDKLAQICGVSGRAIQMLTRMVTPADVGVAALCLGDTRLTARFNFAKGELSDPFGPRQRRNRGFWRP